MKHGHCKKCNRIRLTDDEGVCFECISSLFEVNLIGALIILGLVFYLLLISKIK